MIRFRDTSWDLHLGTDENHITFRHRNRSKFWWNPMISFLVFIKMGPSRDLHNISYFPAWRIVCHQNKTKGNFIGMDHWELN